MLAFYLVPGKLQNFSSNQVSLAFREIVSLEWPAFKFMVNSTMAEAKAKLGLNEYVK